MLGLITFVALMVQVYSLGYMHGDPRFGWYYAFHALFIASINSLHGNNSPLSSKNDR